MKEKLVYNPKEFNLFRLDIEARHLHRLLDREEREIKFLEMIYLFVILFSCAMLLVIR